MIDEFDYKEPVCPLCDGEDFYYPKKDAPLGRIPVRRIVEKVDGLFDKNDYTEAGKLLEYWKNEAIALRDRDGELAMESELVGFYRKQNDRERGLLSIKRALELIEELEQGGMASGATVLINCATASCAFGDAKSSLTLYSSAEKIYKGVLEPNDTRFGGLYNNWALALVETDDFDGAADAYEKALSVMEKADRGEAECAITYINLAHMYEKCGNIEKIFECMAKAKQLLLSENLPHDGYYAFVLEKCAPSFGYFGDKKAYEAFKKESEEIYARA